MPTLLDGYYLSLYAVLCGLSIFCGLGIFSVFGLPIEGKKAILLSPLFTQILLVFLLAINVEFKIPISSSYLVVWLIIAGFAVYGLVRSGSKTFLKNIGMLGGWAILPLCILAWPYWYGSATKFGDILPDGWNYIAFGQYLWKYAIGVEGGLSPLYQHASTLSGSRFTSSAILALFSSLVRHNDASASSGIFLAWALFIFGGACGAFVAEKSLSRLQKVLYVAMVIFSGWIFNVLWATNYDNLLALAYVPALVAMFTSIEYLSGRWAFGIGLAMSALVLVYLELAGVILSILLLIWIVRLIQSDQSDRKRLLGFLSIAFGTGVFVLLPFSKWLFAFLITQVGTISDPTLVRPGAGLFEGLLHIACAPSAYWAMGCEQSAQIPWLYVGGAVITRYLLPEKNILASILCVFTVIGAVALLRKGVWAELIPLLVCLVAAGYMAMVEKYSYGAYKFIVLVWWIIPYLLLVGLNEVERIVAQPFKIVPVLLYLPIILLLTNNLFRVAYVAISKPALLLSDYSQIRDAPIVVQGRPLLINVDDWLGSEWANYYLRDQTAVLNQRRMYMASDPQAVMDREQRVDLSSIQYILLGDQVRDSSVGTRVWRGKPFSLWQLSPDWIIVRDIQNDNGVERQNGKPALWMGKNETRITFLSAYDGIGLLAAELVPGPDLPRGHFASIIMWNGLGFAERIEVSGKRSLQLAMPVRKGYNQIFLLATDMAGAEPPSAGGTRTRLVGVSEIDIHKVDAAGN